MAKPKNFPSTNIYAGKQTFSYLKNVVDANKSAPPVVKKKTKKKK